LVPDPLPDDAVPAALEVPPHTDTTSTTASAITDAKCRLDLMKLIIYFPLYRF
jgi:hypothetical protein